MQIRLDGKRAFVSGASSGIGRQCAIDLAEAGADVVVHGRDRERTEETAAHVRELGRKAVIAIGDLATDEGCDSVARASLEGLGAIDICVNNCGVSLRQDNPRWDELDTEDWLASIQVNFLASVRMGKAFYPAMKDAGWGRIINISTLGAWIPGLLTDYTSPKAALNKLTIDMSKQCGPDGVTVNAILPGTIWTSAIERYLGVLNEQLGWGTDDIAERQKHYLKEIFPQPIQRLGEPHDIGALVVFLASDHAGYVTGALIKCDGGLSPSV
jgi:NAD(P)-dependent dehydrogenase (short-subunit alcohol dehydrogenase family)